jgi:hypothetical protein
MNVIFEIITWIILIIICVKGFGYRKSNILTCGQWGYIGNEFDAKNFKILGLYNETRGVHSCGMYINGEISKGIADQKLWKDFIAKNEIPKELNETHRVCLGHARQASAGYNTHGFDQQHPFVIGDLVGQQNGTVNNAYELGRKYEIPKTEWSVDTQLLYLLINKVGYSVLEEYQGYAALMWVNQNNPNELYLFKGSSPHMPKDDGYWVERPLHYIHEGTGIYFSSMDNSLEAIKSKPDMKVFSVPSNQVLRLSFDENNEIQREVLQEINRDLTRVHTYNNYNRGANVGNASSHQRNSTVMGCQTPSGMNTSTTGTATSTTTGAAGIKKIKKSEFNSRVITTEKCYGLGVAFTSGRWKTNDRFLHGVFRISDTGIIIKPSKANKLGEVYYFFAGIMIKDRATYNEFCKTPWRKGTKERLKKHRHYFRRYAFEAKSEPSWVVAMSRFSKFPIKVTEENCTDSAYHEIWFHEEAVVESLVFIPDFSYSKFYIKDGGILGKTVRPDNAKAGIIHPLNIDNMFKAETNSLTLALPPANKTYFNFGPEDFAVEEEEESDDNSFEKISNTVFTVCESIWDRKFKSQNDFFNQLTTVQIIGFHQFLDVAYNDPDMLPKNRRGVHQLKCLMLTLVGVAVRNKQSIREVVVDIGNTDIEFFVQLVTKSYDDTDKTFVAIRDLYKEEAYTAYIAENSTKTDNSVIEDVDAEDAEEEDNEDNDLGKTNADYQEVERGFLATCQVLADLREEMNRKEKLNLNNMSLACGGSETFLEQDIRHFIMNKGEKNKHLIENT